MSQFDQEDDEAIIIRPKLLPKQRALPRTDI
jgi:hypothetical protein